MVGAPVTFSEAIFCLCGFAAGVLATLLWLFASADDYPNGP